MTRKTTLSIEFDHDVLVKIAETANRFDMGVKDYLIWAALNTANEPTIEEVEFNFEHWPKGQTYEGRGKHSHQRTR